MADPPEDLDIDELMALPHDEFMTTMLFSITKQLTKLTQILLDRELDRKA